MQMIDIKAKPRFCGELCNPIFLVLDCFASSAITGLYSYICGVFTPILRQHLLAGLIGLRRRIVGTYLPHDKNPRVSWRNI